MLSDEEQDTLSGALRRLRSTGVIPAIASPLKAVMADQSQSLLQTSIEAVTAFTESANPDVKPDLSRHIEQHLETITALLGGGPIANFDFVSSYAGRSADRKFPLDAILSMYLGLQHALFRWLRETALQSARPEHSVQEVSNAVSDFVVAYIAISSRQLTADYVQQTRRLAEAEGGRRNKLISILLGGYDEADSQAARLLRGGGYLQQRQSFCVVVARPVIALEMQNPARVERIANAISDVLRDKPLRILTGVRMDMVVAVVSGVRRASGWTAPQSLVADRIETALRTLGPSVLIGISSDAPSTSHIPRAFRESQLALDSASVARRVVPYAKLAFQQLLVHNAVGSLQGALPVWFDSFRDADKKSKGVLAATLRTYAEHDMNVLKSAAALGVHPNTLYARFKRIERCCGRNPLRYQALTELLLALDCVALM